MKLLRNIKGGGKTLAFTLAEVLITLGIIGVVAAMTIPNLISSVETAQFKAIYKKTYAELSQVGKLAYANYRLDFSRLTGIGGYGFQACKDLNEPGMKCFSTVIEATMPSATKTDIYAWCDKGTGDGTAIDSNKEYRISSPLCNDSGSTIYVDGDGSYKLPSGAIIHLYTGTQDKECRLKRGQKVKPKDLNMCGAVIDVNGEDLPNREVTCATGTTSWDLDAPCTVDDDSMGDVFPIVFYNDTVSPATNAAKVVLQEK